MQEGPRGRGQDVPERSLPQVPPGSGIPRVLDALVHPGEKTLSCGAFKELGRRAVQGTWAVFLLAALSPQFSDWPEG